MLTSIRKSRLTKVFSGFMTMTFITVNLAPLNVFALTSGPSQPETQQFAPVGMDNMVDPFTGDFSYNIPLMDVGGYPLNLNYAAGITPDDEASWVGLGWNLNVGAVNRTVRGLPDDFKEDKVTTTANIRANNTYGVNFSPSITQKSFWGVNIPGGINGKINLFYNNYNGFGFSLGVTPSIDIGLGSKSNYKIGAGVGFSLGSEEGVGIAPTFGLGPKMGALQNQSSFNASLSFPYSSREGLKGMTLGAGYKPSNKYGSSDFGSSAHYGFAYPSYTPNVSHDMLNINASIGVGLVYSNTATESEVINVSGYYAGQFLQDKVKENPAYGYLYAGSANVDLPFPNVTTENSSALLDFNREKDNGVFNEKTQNLALANFTHDIFSVSGQGISGTYRLYRGDVGRVGDPYFEEKSRIVDLNVSIGVGDPPSGFLSADVKYTGTGTVSNRWIDANFQSFKDPDLKHNSPDENVYFKKIGEMTPETDATFLNEVQKSDNTMTYKLTSKDGNVSDRFYGLQGRDLNVIKLNQDNQRTLRRKRNSSFTFLTAGEVATSSATSNVFKKYAHNYNSFQVDKTNTASRADLVSPYESYELPITDGSRRDNHLSFLQVTDNSGSRYQYAIPVYNHTQDEVTFSVDATASNEVKTTGLISYTETEASKDNKSGQDHYYNKVHTPAFATSFLLTSILSSDYYDSDAVTGPSDGDLGNYTKFNYVKTSNNFKWRTPYVEGKASFSDGLEAKTTDNKGNYVYGEKEIWYVHSVVTRTHIAEFHLSKRQDGRGVVSDRGGLSTSEENSLYKLDSVCLYSKADKLNGKTEALKTVHFEYDYSLCKGTPNSSAAGQGKLTLKKVWFTYGLAGKGVLNPYVFNYADANFDGVPDTELNPNYNQKAYDRWGVYKPEGASAGLRNEAFPYVGQDKSTQDKYAATYAITSIHTPTGGTIRVHYESDDYAYVQNKRAMRMYPIIGFGKTGTDERLYDLTDLNPFSIDAVNKTYLKVDISSNPIKKTSDLNKDLEVLRKEYLEGIDLMYYKANLNVINNLEIDSEDKDLYNYVPGYSEIEINNCQLGESGDISGYYDIAYIKLEMDKTDGGRNINPIIRNGFMFDKANLGRELKGLKDGDSQSLLQVVKAVLAAADEVIRFTIGFVNSMELKGHCNKIKNDRSSFVRLNDPDKVKLGGGHRVKAIVMSDNWVQMTGKKEIATSSLNKRENAFYGQVYEYTIEENSAVETNAITKEKYYTKISSGVAQYEPAVGNDENPFRRPKYTREKAPLGPSKEFYMEEPFGEMLFPSPSVGYRKVRTTPLKITNVSYNAANQWSLSGLKGNGTGYVEQEFYTAKDFPTITEQTGIDFKRDKPNLILKFIQFGAQDIVTCAQGYKVELNDMHGKEKSKKVMPDATANANVNPISYVRYEYKLDAQGRLDNKVKYIDKDLSITAESPNLQLGVDVDVVHDTKFYKSVSAGGGIDINTKGIFPAIPIIGVVPIPSVTSDYVEFKSVSTTKTVNKAGILVRTIAMDNGQTITTENLAWDKETGEVLLTKVENEFHDPIWNFTYPAYWAYSRMELAYQNENAILDDNSKFGAFASSTLKDGDELMAQYKKTNNEVVKGLLYCVKSGGTTKIIDRLGTEIQASNITFLKVLRSGARNMATTPVGSVSLKEDPLKVGATAINFQKVINAGATEFKDDWKAFCNCSSISGNTNPFTKGLRGNLRPWKSWTYLTSRHQNRSNGVLEIRQDGYFDGTYVPFWASTSTGIAPVANVGDTRWHYVTQIENYNPVGMEIENKDALGRYSMAQFGYGRNLPVGTSNNSKYQESGFDGFEDYEYGDCNDDHFSWRSQLNNGSSTDGGLSTSQAHTGRKSIKVLPSKTLSIVKVIDPCNTTTSGSTSTGTGTTSTGGQP